MTAVNGAPENLVLVECFSPYREEIGESEIPRLRGLHVKGAGRVVRVDRVHAGETDADIRRNILLLTIHEDLKMRMDVECRKHIGGATKRKLPVSLIRGGMIAPPEEPDDEYDCDSRNPPSGV